MDGSGKEACPDGSADGMLLDGSLAQDPQTAVPQSKQHSFTARLHTHTHQLSHSCTAATALLISMLKDVGLPHNCGFCINNTII